MADTNTNEGRAQANDKYLHNSNKKKKGKEKSIVTIRTRRVGGTTRVCCVHVCFLVCALISTSAAVPVKPRKHEEEGNVRLSASGAWARCDLILQTRTLPTA